MYEVFFFFFLINLGISPTYKVSCFMKMFLICDISFGLAQIPSCSNFKYEVLEKATESFHDSVKLGQGGAGSVYKGILPDGRVVAVKKLFFNTREWADQFFNEVNLISGVQHKNLVRLLGCSIEGPKSLLVYEYVQNRSLDQILFSKLQRSFTNKQSIM